MAHGGFARVTGDPGHGKSKTLQGLAGRLTRLPDVTVRVMERPQNRLADCSRELGDLSGVPLTPANRSGGFKVLRARWRAPCEATLVRPVRPIDEAPERASAGLPELRLLARARFDAERLRCALLCGDQRLPERFRTPERRPWGSRIRALGPLAPEEWQAYPTFSLQQAGAPPLCTPALVQTLVTQAAGNLGGLTGRAAELLAAPAERNLPRLDEALSFQVLAPSPKPRRARPPDGAKGP